LRNFVEHVGRGAVPQVRRGHLPQHRVEQQQASADVELGWRVQVEVKWSSSSRSYVAHILSKYVLGAWRLTVRKNDSLNRWRSSVKKPLSLSFLSLT
jgi:hypothetical protein